MKDTCKQTSQHRRAPRVELICIGRDQPKTRIQIFQQANVAKQLLHALGYPLVVDLKTIIKTNVIQDSPITESNTKLMEHLYGPNIPTVKGKTTR